MAPSRIHDYTQLPTPEESPEHVYFPNAEKAEKESLLHHSLITSDFDALRFSAASSLQLRNPQLAPGLPLSNHLISSPYNDTDHLLDLSDLEAQDSLFARALSVLRPTRPDYATAPFLDSLNWPAVLATLRTLAASEAHDWKQQSFYVVIFRSKLRADADIGLLNALDKHSHAEATVSGGLLKYWFGSRDGERRNLATCLWRGRDDARAGGTGPWHKKARLAARELYEFINFSTWRLTVAEGARAFTLEEWLEGRP